MIAGKEVKTDEYFLGKYNADEFFKDSDHIEKETAASIAAGKGQSDQNRPLFLSGKKKPKVVKKSQSGKKKPFTRGENT